jgi:hypothetical protein
MRRVVVLVVGGLVLGALLTGAVGALPGSQDLTPLGWLGTVSTVAALVVAVGIYHVQQVQSDAAHQELLDLLTAQDEILQDLAEATPPDVAASPDVATPPEPVVAQEPAAPTRPPEPRPGAMRPGDGVLTAEQRAAVEARYGDDRIAAAWQPRGRRGERARLVRLDDDTLLAVFSDGRGRVHVHQVRPRREGGGPWRDLQARGPRGT